MHTAPQTCISRRTLFGGIAGATAGAILAACGDTANPTTPVTTVRPSGTAGASTAPAANYLPPLPAGTTVNIVWYNLAAAGAIKEVYDQLLGEFAAANPNIKVEARGIPAADSAAKVQADVVAGNVPDLLQGVFSDLDFVANELKAPAVEDLVSPAELAEWSGGEFPMSVNGLKLAALNGKTYGVPFNLSTQTLYYNANLLTMAGLDPNKPPATWNEVKQYALQIKERTGKEGIVIPPSDWMFQAIAGSNGGRVMTEDRRTLTYTQPETVAAAQMWQDLVKSGAHPALSADNTTMAFTSSNLGMTLWTSALQANFVAAAAKGGWTLHSAKMPAFGGKPTTPVNSGSGLFILSRDRLKQRAAWELMKFLTSARAYTTVTSKIGYLPLRPGIVNDDRYLKPYVQMNPLVQPNLEQLERLRPWVAFPGSNYRQIFDLMTKAEEEVIYGGADAERTLKAAQDRSQSLMPKR